MLNNYLKELPKMSEWQSKLQAFQSSLQSMDEATMSNIQALHSISQDVGKVLADLRKSRVEGVLDMFLTKAKLFSAALLAMPECPDTLQKVEVLGQIYHELTILFPLDQQHQACECALAAKQSACQCATFSEQLLQASEDFLATCNQSEVTTASKLEALKKAEQLCASMPAPSIINDHKKTLLQQCWEAMVAFLVEQIPVENDISIEDLEGGLLLLEKLPRQLCCAQLSHKAICDHVQSMVSMKKALGDLKSLMVDGVAAIKTEKDQIKLQELKRCKLLFDETLAQVTKAEVGTVVVTALSTLEGWNKSYMDVLDATITGWSTDVMGIMRQKLADLQDAAGGKTEGKHWSDGLTATITLPEVLEKFGKNELFEVDPEALVALINAAEQAKQACQQVSAIAATHIPGDLQASLKEAIVKAHTTKATGCILHLIKEESDSAKLRSGVVGELKALRNHSGKLENQLLHKSILPRVQSILKGQ
eukprot:1140146-Amphidinium_carterae.1